MFSFMINETQITSEDIFWPPKITMNDVWFSSLWVLVVWLLYSIVLLILVVVLWKEVSSIFIFILSIATFLVILFSSWTILFMNRLLLPHKYKKTSQIYWSIWIYNVILYVFMLPIYVISISRIETEYMIYVFVLHSLLWVFWSILMTEILSQYKYLLLSVYASFIGLFTSSIIIILIFSWLKFWTSALTSLIWVLPLSLLLTHFFKILTEYAYYNLYLTTWTDFIGGIFDEVRREEEVLEKEAERDLD